MSTPKTPVNTKRQSHAFQADYDAKQHAPEGCLGVDQYGIVTLTHEDYTHLSVVEYLPGCYRLCVSDGYSHAHTHCTRVDPADIADYYYNAYDYTDEDDEIFLYRLMTSIALIKLFDGMRKFVEWEEV